MDVDESPDAFADRDSDNGSFDVDIDGDMLSEDEEAQALPVLCESMNTAELRSYLEGFKTQDGVLLFSEANFTHLEFCSMAALYDLSGHDRKWKTVVACLFDGDLPTAQLFQIKVRDARRRDAEVARSANIKLAKAAQKQSVLAAKRLLDPSAPPPETRPDPPRKDPTAGMMLGNKSLAQTCALQYYPCNTAHPSTPPSPHPPTPPHHPLPIPGV